MVEWPSSSSRALSIAGLSALAACADPTIGLPDGDGRVGLAPAQLDFGEVPIGDRRALDVEITPPPGVEVGLFELRPPFSATITQRTGNAVTVRVTYAPQRPIASAAILVVQVRGQPDVDVPLTGRGTEGLVLDPPRVAFGAVQVGDSASRTVTLTNVTAGPREVAIDRGSGVTACSDTAPACFDARTRPLLDGRRLTLAPRESVAFEARYRPIAAGHRLGATVRFRACETCPFLDTALSLEGTAVDHALACDPAVMDLGAVAVGHCATRAVRCTNVTTEPVLVSGAALDAPASAELTLVRAPSPVILVEGASVELSARFCPLDEGAETGRLLVHDDGGRDLVVPVSARGVIASLSLTPTALDFGVVARGVPALQRVFVHNRGSAEATLTRVALATTSFSAQAESMVIPPGATRAIVVEARATTAGLATDRLHVSTEDLALSEFEIPVRALVVDAPECAYQVSAAALDFGEVGLDRTLRRGIEVHNVGTTECLVTSVSVPPGDLTLASGPDQIGPGTRIGAGQVAVLSIDYTPRAVGPLTGQLELSMASARAPRVSIALEGSSAERAPVPGPRELNLGAVPEACGISEEVRLYNTTADTIALTSIGVEPPGAGPFTVVVPPFGWVIRPGDSMPVEVRFQAGAPRTHAHALAFQGTRAGRPQRWYAALTATARPVAARQTDHFEAPARPVDVLMVVDDSCSMGQRQRLLADQAATFLAAAGATSDYQIGVTTTDVELEVFGQLLPLQGGDPADRRITAASLPTPADALAARISGVGARSSANERGLQAALLALSHPLARGHNAGLLRGPADRAVLVLSDEQDYSLDRVSAFVDLLRDITGVRRRDDLSLSAIVGDADGGCATSAGAADSGSRYVEAAQQTGGQFHSICATDWAPLASALGTHALGPRTRFTLSSAPKPDTLEVTIDGVRVPSGLAWSYDADAGAVVFTPAAAPTPDAQIDIAYEILCL